MPDEEKSPTDRLLDLFVFGPLGFVLEAEELVPRLAEKGRTTVGSQVGTARVIGQMVVAQGRRELDRQVERLRANGPSAHRPQPEPEPEPEAAATPDPTPTEAAPTAPTAPAAASRSAARPRVEVVTAEADDALEEEREIVLDAAAPSPPRHDADEAAGLAIPDYDSLAASQVVPRLAGLAADELEAVRRYEAAHRGRRTILARVAQLQAGR